MAVDEGPVTVDQVVHVKGVLTYQWHDYTSRMILDWRAAAAAVIMTDNGSSDEELEMEIVTDEFLFDSTTIL